MTSESGLPRRVLPEPVTGPIHKCFSRENKGVWSMIRQAGPSPLPNSIDPAWIVPSDEDCFALWDEMDMLDNIRDHSLKVARVATWVAEHGLKAGLATHVQTVRAGALLHDIAKTYSIEWGGYHGPLGGAWVMERTRNPVLAQCIVHHVFWPWELDLEAYFTVFAVLYGDKRVRHDRLVTVDERFEDLSERYGHSRDLVRKIEANRVQSVVLENMMSERLGVDLHACDFDSRRMV
jgi:putative nucleotidyltransferase with HDIG domain